MGVESTLSVIEHFKTPWWDGVKAILLQWLQFEEPGNKTFATKTMHSIHLPLLLLVYLNELFEKARNVCYDDPSAIQQPFPYAYAFAYACDLTPWNWQKFLKPVLRWREPRQNISVYGSNIKEKLFEYPAFLSTCPLNLAVCCGNLQSSMVGREMAQRSCIAAKKWTECDLSSVCTILLARFR